MPIIILTGPAACGKSTISHFLAQNQEKCAIIDVDIVRQMYFQPHKAPWEGKEGQNQQKLGVENACLLAKNFIKEGLDIIILDVVVNETAKLYRQHLPEAKIILLMPTYQELYRRFTIRPYTISEEEFKMLYAWEEALSDYDGKIDNTNLTPEGVVEKVNSFY